LMQAHLSSFPAVPARGLNGGATGQRMLSEADKRMEDGRMRSRPIRLHRTPWHCPPGGAVCVRVRLTSVGHYSLTWFASLGKRLNSYLRIR
jgi:hypothetical protein